MSPTARATDTWTTREVPILVAISETLDPGERLPVGEIQIPGLAPDDITRSLLSLDDGGYVELDNRRGLVDAVTKLTPAGRRAAGQWPSAEDLVPRLVEALTQVADTTDDLAQKGRLRQAAATLGGVGRQIAVEISTKMLEHQMGLA
jgi:hypothetical protein